MKWLIKLLFIYLKSSLIWKEKKEGFFTDDEYSCKMHERTINLKKLSSAPFSLFKHLSNMIRLTTINDNIFGLNSPDLFRIASNLLSFDDALHFYNLVGNTKSNRIARKRCTVDNRKTLSAIFILFMNATMTKSDQKQ